MHALVWLGMIAGAVTSISIIWRQAVRPMMKWAMRVEKAMSFVEAQMVPNGGTSLRDSVNRIEARLLSLEEHVTSPR